MQNPDDPTQRKAAAALRLTPKERADILAGDTETLTRPTKPNLTPGDEIVIAWSRPRRYCDPETGHVFNPPATPAASIKIANVARRVKGGWTIQFKLTDNRQTALMLAPGNGYTTDHRTAIDDLEVVLSAEDLARYAVEARAKQLAQRVTSSEQERRRRERAVRDRLRETLRQLPPAAQVSLLAEIERTIRDAIQAKEVA